MWDGFTQKMYDGFAWLANKIMVPIYAILGWLQDFKDFIVETYNSFTTWLSEVLTSITADILTWGNNFLSSAYNWSLENIIPIAQGVIDFIYDKLDWLFAMGRMVANFTYVFDYFLPLTELFIGLTGLLLFWSVIFVIKVLLKAIPTIW